MQYFNIMPNKNLNKFFLSIVVPSILAIALFIISFWLIIIPLFEQSLMDRKKEMIRELTHTAWSIIDEKQIEFSEGIITLDSAKNAAARQIEQMRYGNERKDYFWIIDYLPKMIMHPYRKELNGCNLSEFKDLHEKKLFVDAATLVKNQNEGFIDYYWQWKDDTSRIVPKLSYVKGFSDWEWIVGTGIYLDDVRKETKHLKDRVLVISSIIIGIIILTLIYVIRQSLLIEKKRKAAELKLVQSKQKYKTLVDASTEGTLMFVNKKLVFNNMKFASMFVCDTKELTNKLFDDIFTINWTEVLGLFTDPKKTITIETQLKCNGNQKKDVVISISKIFHSNEDAYIVICKDVSPKKQLEKSTQKLSDELQTSLQLMNQPIKPFMREIITCPLNTKITDAAKLMSDKNQKILFIKQNNSILGTINDTDLRKRVLASGYSPTSPVSEIMTAPVQYINDNALLYEAVLLFKKFRVSHLLVNNSKNQASGTISNQDALEMQRNSLSYLVQEIETAKQIENLKKIYDRLPVLVNAILANSDNAQNITRIITSVADAITTKVIELTIETNGTPPCEFAFIAMGSEGRKEQTLKTDQDNAIIFADSEESEIHKIYFLTLAEAINKHLHFIGYKYCEGGIMAKNEKWCQPFSKWKNQFYSWINSPDPQNILDSSIFFDFRCIYGNDEMVQELQIHVHSELSRSDLFFYHMANSIIQFKTIANEDVVDIKKLLLPVIGFIRTYALFKQINKNNTLERLNKLTDLKVIQQEKKNELLQIYNFLMQLRLKNQVQQILDNNIPDNSISENDLSQIEQNTLKKSIEEIKQLQLKLALDFKRGS